jgi:hypothetical protein
LEVVGLGLVLVKLEDLGFSKVKVVKEFCQKAAGLQGVSVARYDRTFFHITFNILYVYAMVGRFCLDRV